MLYQENECLAHLTVHFPNLEISKSVKKQKFQDKSNKNEHADTENRIGVTRGEGVVEGKMDKGDQLYGDGAKVNFWW